MEAKDEFWVDGDEDDKVAEVMPVKYLSSTKSNFVKPTKSIVIDHNNHAILLLRAAFGSVFFPRDAALFILEESVLCWEGDISDLFDELESMGSVSCVNRTAGVYSFTAVGINRADQMEAKFLRKGFKQSVLTSWVCFWVSSLETLSTQFLVDDVGALQDFQQNQVHFAALFKCLCSRDNQTPKDIEWCYHTAPGSPCYVNDHLDISFPPSEVDRIIDIVCESSFLSFVLTPTAHQLLSTSLHTIAHRNNDAKRYARLSVVMAWSKLEWCLYGLLTGHLSDISDSCRDAKDLCEASEKLQHIIVQTMQSEPPELSNGANIKKDWCETLNVMGLALTCLGCEVPACRKHREAAEMTNRLHDVFGESRSIALEGLALVSMGVREGSDDIGELTEAAGMVVKALNMMEERLGRDHLSSLWLLSLSSFILGQLTSEQRQNFPVNIDLVGRGGSVAQSKLDSKHPSVAFACGVSAKVLCKLGRSQEALDLAEAALKAFRYNIHSAIDNISEHTKNMERDVDNYRRRARRSTRMGHA